MFGMIKNIVNRFIGCIRKPNSAPTPAPSRPAVVLTEVNTPAEPEKVREVVEAPKHEPVQENTAKPKRQRKPKVEKGPEKAGEPKVRKGRTKKKDASTKESGA